MSKPIVESFTVVGSRGVNEDAMFIAEEAGLFAVFDGASPLDKTVNADGKLTGGQIASQTAHEVFSENPDKDLPTLLALANIAIGKKQIITNDAATLRGTTITAVRHREDYLEVATVGDSPLIIIDKNKRAHPAGGLENWDTESLLLWKELKNDGVENPRRHPRMEEQLKKVRRQANRQYGYCNGDPAMEDFIRTSVYSTKNIGAVLLMSDGCMLPQQDPTELPDWRALANLYIKGGAVNVAQTVSKIEQTDPECVTYPRFKTHDDKSIIALLFAGR